MVGLSVAFRRHRVNARLKVGVLGTVVLLAMVCACKEKPREPVQRRVRTERSDSMKVSQNIERLSNELKRHQAADLPESAASKASLFKSVDLNAYLDDERIVIDVPKRIALSAYDGNKETRTVRVAMDSRGVGRNNAENIENRLFDMLNDHAPEPWNLQRVRRGERTDATISLNVQFQRKAERLRRIVKTAPLRSNYRFEVALTMRGIPHEVASWNGWQFDLSMEAGNHAENVVVERFWKGLSESLPMLTVIDMEQTAQWIRAQGFSPKILSGDLSGMKLPRHRYYAAGCLVSKEKESNGESPYVLRLLNAPYAPPQVLNINRLEDMVCSRDAFYSLEFDSPLNVSIRYAPYTAAHAWKTSIALDDAATIGTNRLYSDSSITCMWAEEANGIIRSPQIHCVDSKNGDPKWKLNAPIGGVRGFAADQQQLAFATDQALFALSRDGHILNAQRLETKGRSRQNQSCQLGNRLIFTIQPTLFVAYHLQTHEIDWTFNALDPKFIHCSRDDIFLLSESGGYLLAMDVPNHTPLWKYQTYALPHDAMTYGNTIYLLMDRAILALDRMTGRRVAQIPLPWRAERFIQNSGNVYLDTSASVFTW